MSRLRALTIEVSISDSCERSTGTSRPLAVRAVCVGPEDAVRADDLHWDLRVSVRVCVRV